MEGSPGDIIPPPEKKGESKSDKKTEKAVGLGKSTFEFAHKKEAAEKTSSIFEKLIPKEGAENPKVELPFESDAPVKAEKLDAKTDEVQAEITSSESAEEINDPTIENLTEGEKAEVVKDYAHEKAAELEAGSGGAEDPLAAAERQANIDFLKSLEQEAAATPVEAVAEEQLPEAQAEADTVTASEFDTPTEFEDDQELNLSTPEQASAEADAEAAAQQAAAAGGAGQPPAPPAPQSGGGSGSQPPRGPNAAPFGPNWYGGPGGPTGPGSTPNTPNFNAPPAANAPNTPPTPNVHIETNNYYQENGGAYLLAGGILGYMLGRRRGRIKTERHMKAVSKKLEQQINTVRQEVARQEVSVRQQARERFIQSREIRGAETTAARTVDAGRKVEAATRLSVGEVTANRRQAAERLGVTEATAAVTAERVQRMDHREVLAIAEKVVIDGTSLRTIYEAKQITEPGLRRITREFLRGGDIKAALQAEIQVKEMQYERDPQMRDRLAASYADVDAAQPRTSTEAMASLLAHGVNPKPTQMHDSVRQAHEEAEAAKKRGKQVLVSAWAVLVVVLVIVAVILATR